MTRRAEFSAKTKDRAFSRAAGKCELCSAPLRPGHIEYDHRLPDALGGKNDIANCQVLCSPCHSAKTAKEDVPRIRKADRQRKAHVGARVVPVKTIPSPQPSISIRTAQARERGPRPMLPRRDIYQDIRR